MPALGDRIPIPTTLNEEDVPFAFGPIALSIRSLITVLVGMILWFVLGWQIIGNIIGIFWIGLLVTIAIPIVTIYVAFATREGMPLDYYLANRMIYMMEGQYYTLRIENNPEDVQFFDEVEDFYYG